MKHSLLILLLFSICSYAFAQQYNFSSYSIENGLAQSQVYVIYEDSRGYIWIGTDGGGISMFDGVGFTNLTEENGLSSNQIRSIYEDSRHNMWFGTKDGYVNKYDGVTFQQYNQDNGLSSSTVLSISEDISGNILLGTMHEGLFRFNNDHFEKVKISENDSINITIKALCVSKDGFIWIGSEKYGVFVGDNKGFKKLTIKNGLANNRINSILEDYEGNIWVATQNGLSKFNGDNFVNYSVSDGLCSNKIKSIAIDKAGILWFGSLSKGVSQYNGNLFYTFNESNGLCNDFIMSMTCDRNNNMWFGTDHGGICKFDGERFKHLTERDGLPGNIVMTLYEDKDSNVWIGTYGNGICKYKDGVFKSYSTSDGLCSDLIYHITQDKNGNIWCASKGFGASKFDGTKFTTFNTTNGLPSDFIYSIIEDRYGNLWFGTLGGGISIYDGENFTNIGFDEGLSTDYVYYIFEDKEGNIWLGTDGAGVAMIFASYTSNDIINNKKIPEDYLINITKFGLTNKQVLSIVQDRNDNIWIGTFGGGITRFDGVDLKNFSVKHGLNSNNIYLLLADSYGSLWAGTEKGLNKIEISDNSDSFNVKTYATDEGFIGIETNFNSVIEDHNGIVWFGNLRGATMYNPKVDNENELEPRTHIRNVKLFFEDINWEQFTDSVTDWAGIPKNLILPHDQNHLTFEFIGIDNRSPKKVKYQWILEGFDKNWSPLSDKTNVTYQNIPPGEFTFKLKAFNNDGYGNKEPVTFSFRIPPPWYKTLWAYFCYFGLFVIILYLSIRMNTRRLKSQNIKLEKIIQDRTKEIKSQRDELARTLKELKLAQNKLIESEKMASLGNLVAGVAHEINTPVGIGITSSSLLTDTVRNLAKLYNDDKLTNDEFEDKLQTIYESSKLISDNLQRAADLVYNFKQVSVDKATEQKREFKLKEYIENVIKSLNPEFKNQNIKIVISGDERITLDSYPGAIAQIVTNMVINSKKYAFDNMSEGFIEIDILKRNNNIIFEYKDNGHGISKENLLRIFEPFFTTDKQKGTGLGMHITYNLVTQKLDGTIECNSEPEKGVQFLIILPIK